MKALFRVKFRGYFPQADGTWKKAVFVTVEEPRNAAKTAIIAEAIKQCPAANGGVRWGDPVLVDKAGDVLSLAPKFGAEYIRAARTKTLEWLLADKLENYGYDWPDYRRLIAQRARARAAVRRISCYGHAPDALAWDDVGSRLIVDDRRPDYCVGQSSNEEITNVLRTLARVRGGWVS